MLLPMADGCRRQGKTSREEFSHHNEVRKEKEKKKLFAPLRAPAAHLSALLFMQEDFRVGYFHRLIN